MFFLLLHMSYWGSILRVSLLRVGDLGWMGCVGLWKEDGLSAGTGVFLMGQKIAS